MSEEASNRVTKQRYPRLSWWERRKVWWSMNFGGMFRRKKKGDKPIRVHLD